MPYLPIERFTRALPAMQALIADLVQIESPSTDKAAIDRLAERVLPEVTALGGQIERFPQATAGDHYACRWGESGPGGILLLVHLDTVHELGTLAHTPFRTDGERMYGPGVLDMKTSLVMALACIQMFREDRQWPARSLTLLLTSDEETGSTASRALIEQEARRVGPGGMAFCLEPALASGAIKTARKGTGDIELRVQGVAAHAGIDHEKGHNAIEELAHHILAAQRLTDYQQGTTVNVGVVAGGTRPNVVPEHASAVIDFRVTRMEEARRLEDWAQSIRPVDPSTTVETVFMLNRPPMPRDEVMARSYQKAQQIAEGLGLTIHEGSTGGGSDANFIAPLGVPVLDGLGPVGDGAHSTREFVTTASIPERSALLAALLLNW